MHAANPAQLAQVQLQAAVAEAALGEYENAADRLDHVLALPAPDLLSLVKVTADYIDRSTLVSGHEWATGGPPVDGENRQSLDERVPPARALTLRLMSAWSAKDLDSFTALFQAAVEDPDGRSHIRDLFTYALEWTKYKADASINPPVMVKLLCKAMTDHGPSAVDWPDPGDIS